MSPLIREGLKEIGKETLRTFALVMATKAAERASEYLYAPRPTGPAGPPGGSSSTGDSSPSGDPSSTGNSEPSPPSEITP